MKKGERKRVAERAPRTGSASRRNVEADPYSQRPIGANCTISEGTKSVALKFRMRNAQKQKGRQLREVAPPPVARLLRGCSRPTKHRFSLASGSAVQLRIFVSWRGDTQLTVEIFALL
jgi:hypothetical protein